MADDGFFSACPDPELASLLSKLPEAPKIHTDDLPSGRIWFNTVFTEIYRSIQRKQLPSEETYVTTDHHIPVDGGSILIRTYRPFAPDGTTFPLFVWTHGGGFVFGDVDMDDYYWRILTIDLQVAIANVEYRLAPEHSFPTGLNDAYAALKWIIQNAKSIQADPAKGVIIGGQSAGANFPAVIAHRAQKDPFFADYPVTGQVLQIPVLLHPDGTPEKYADRLTSYADNYDKRILNEGHLRDYFGESTSKLQCVTETDPEISVLFQPSFNTLPPAYIQVCGRDPLKDEGIVYGEILEGSGVPVKVDLYPGVPHAFHLMFPTSQLALQLDKDFRAGIRWLLNCPKHAV
ncbi:Alpha/Beta hydrolase protein [Lenzites betulinus]|nr:Alpha/Beta hydrolase protein [Lenzites betulinus]